MKPLSKRTFRWQNLTLIDRPKFCHNLGGFWRFSWWSELILLAFIAMLYSVYMHTAARYDVRTCSDVIKWRHHIETFSVLLTICAGNSPVPGWVNNREAGDLRRYRAHYDVTAMVARIGRKISLQLCVFIFNSSHPTQNGRHFADDVFRSISVKEKYWIFDEYFMEVCSWGHSYRHPCAQPILPIFRTTAF